MRDRAGVPRTSTLTSAGCATVSEALDGSGTVYVDANIFIYLIEDAPGKADLVARAFEKIANQGGSVVTSELTVAECCYKPAREKNAPLLSAYERLFERSGDVRLVPLTGATAKTAALLGAGLGLKLFDAIHYVSALEARCAVLLTSDNRFKSGSGLTVVRI